MHPDDGVVAAIALGEEVTPAQAAHVESCPQCGVLVAELGETMAQARDGSGEALISPPDTVWRAIAAEMGSAIPGPVDELAQRRRRPLTWLGVAAGVAAGVVVGVIGPRLLPQPASPAPQVLARAELKTLDTSTPGGDVELLAGQDPALDLRIRVTPLDAGPGYLEVWLINNDLKRMVSIGVLPNGSSGQDFVIPRELIDQGYVIVDISKELLDASPEHSGKSLLRGSLA